jgi:hypothetical protein
LKWPFGRRERTALDVLKASNWTCRSCEQRHQGMFDLGALVPNVWPDPWEYEPNGALRLEGSFLSEDFCVLDGEFFLVRGVLNIPVRGMADSFGYGVWCSLKKENFIDYVDHFDCGFPDDAEPWWSWLCNMAQPYHDGAESLGGQLYPRSGRLRPLFFVDDENHPLAIAQRNGISPEDVLAIYEFYGHAPAV